tara:strand:- start:706 stop:1566 length:861 start_codon:yes stop_codon:yes gene_type:complete
MGKKDKASKKASRSEDGEDGEEQPAKKFKTEAEPDAAAAAASSQPPPAEEHLIYAGGLPYSYDEETIRSSFSECGEIVKIHRMCFEDSGKFRGIALLTFATAQGAGKAIEWDGTEWEGRFLTVKPGKAEPKAAPAAAAEPEWDKKDGSTTAYVGNLSYEATEADLREKFAGVVGVRFKTDKDTGKPRGFAFVEFASEAALDEAMKLNGTPVRGRPLKMHYSATAKSVQPPTIDELNARSGKGSKGSKGGKGGKGGKGDGKGKGKGKGRGGERSEAGGRGSGVRTVF